MTIPSNSKMAPFAYSRPLITSKVVVMLDAIKNISGRETVAKLSQVNFAEDMEGVQKAIRRNLDKLRDEMLSMGFSESTIQMAMRGFNWVDKFGNVLKTQINEKGEIIF